MEDDSNELDDFEGPEEYLEIEHDREQVALDVLIERPLAPVKHLPRKAHWKGDPLCEDFDRIIANGFEPEVEPELVVIGPVRPDRATVVFALVSAVLLVVTLGLGIFGLYLNEHVEKLRLVKQLDVAREVVAAKTLLCKQQNHAILVQGEQIRDLRRELDLCRKHRCPTSLRPVYFFGGRLVYVDAETAYRAAKSAWVESLQCELDHTRQELELARAGSPLDIWFASIARYSPQKLHP